MSGEGETCSTDIGDSSLTMRFHTERRRHTPIPSHDSGLLMIECVLSVGANPSVLLCFRTCVCAAPGIDRNILVCGSTFHEKMIATVSQAMKLLYGRSPPPSAVTSPAASRPGSPAPPRDLLNDLGGPALGFSVVDGPAFLGNLNYPLS